MATGPVVVGVHVMAKVVPAETACPTDGVMIGLHWLVHNVVAGPVYCAHTAAAVAARTEKYFASILMDLFRVNKGDLARG